jgi:hypothetical protein
MQAGHKRKVIAEGCRQGMRDKDRERVMQAGHKRKRHSNRDADRAGGMQAGHTRKRHG